MSKSEIQFDPKMLEALVCPMTHASLSYDSDKQELISKGAKVAYPIRNGIPVMSPSEARVID